MGETIAADPALAEVEETCAAGDLVVVVGTAVPEAAGLPSLPAVLGLLLARARKRRPGATERIAELAALVEAERVPAAFSAAKALLGPEYDDEIEKALGGQARAVPTVARAVAALAPRLSAVSVGVGRCPFPGRLDREGKGKGDAQVAQIRAFLDGLGQ